MILVREFYFCGLGRECLRVEGWRDYLDDKQSVSYKQTSEEGIDKPLCN